MALRTNWVDRPGAPADPDTSYTVTAAAMNLIGTEFNRVDSYFTSDVLNNSSLDATLAALAGVTVAANKLIYATGADAFTTMDFTAAGRALLDDADAAAQRTTLGLAIGTNVQAFNANLAAIAALSDPNADRLLFWDDSAGALAYLTLGTNLSITGTTINATGGGGGGTGDVVGPSSSVDSEIALFSSTTGKLIKRASISGLAKLTSGVLSAATAGTDYVIPSGSVATLSTPRNIDGVAFDGSAAITVLAPATHAATAKTTPIDADEFPIVDTAASNVLKRTTLGNVKALINPTPIVLTSTLTLPAVANTDYVYLLGTSGLPTLPTAVANTSRYTVKNTTGSAINIATTSSQTVEGAAGPYSLSPNESVTLVSNNANWWII